MQDEILTNQNQEITTHVVEQNKATEVKLSNGAILTFNPNREILWDDYCTWQDLGSKVKGGLNEKNDIEIDMSNSAAGLREQKIWLIKFYWEGAEEVKFGKLGAEEVANLYIPIKNSGVLKKVEAAFKDEVVKG
jgi:hypothetical protein